MSTNRSATSHVTVSWIDGWPANLPKRAHTGPLECVAELVAAEAPALHVDQLAILLATERDAVV